MKYALFSVPVGTIYDLPQTIKEGEEGLVSTIGDEGLYGQTCQVRTAPGGVTAAGGRHGPQPDGGGHRHPLRPMVERGGSESGHRPRLPHRAAQPGAGV